MNSSCLCFACSHAPIYRHRTYGKRKRKNPTEFDVLRDSAYMRRSFVSIACNGHATIHSHADYADDVHYAFIYIFFIVSIKEWSAATAAGLELAERK